MKNETNDLCFVPPRWMTAMFLMLVISLMLNVIVAVGNWQLYSRVEKLESIVESPATPQSQQKP
jgi:cytochrome oxidase assembly protein ShyY1